MLRNKLRSFLTMLGIIIGVFAVIAMVAVGDGATAHVQDLFASIGTNMLIVLPGASNQGGAFGGFGTQPTLTWDDLKAMRDRSAHRALRRRSAAQATSGTERRPQLEYQHQRNLARLLRHSRLARRQGCAVHRSPIWTARPRPPSSAKPWWQALRSDLQSRRPDHSHQQRALPSDRRARIQGAIDARAGQRRRRVHPRNHLPIQNSGRHTEVCQWHHP